MTKRIIVAIIAAVPLGIAYYLNRLDKKLYAQLPQAPELSPELSLWMKYVERYPNLEDDPKIKNALDVLNKHKSN